VRVPGAVQHFSSSIVVLSLSGGEQLIGD
jgi:hypothetical protein